MKTPKVISPLVAIVKAAKAEHKAQCMKTSQMVKEMRLLSKGKIKTLSKESAELCLGVFKVK